MNRKQRNQVPCPKCGRHGLRRPWNKETKQRVDDPLYCRFCNIFVNMHPTQPESLVRKAEPLPEVKEGTDG